VFLAQDPVFRRPAAGFVRRAPDEVVSAAAPPPAISGGNMIATRDERALVVGDSDRDVVWVLRPDATVVHRVELASGDEPGRLVEDNAGRVHVVLRGAGQIATVDLATGALVRRVRVCPVPRGVAFDAAADALRVACMGGELVTVSLSSAETSTVQLEPDLRDVVVRRDDLVVSTFRHPKLFFLDRALRVTGSIDLANVPGIGRGANTAWRMTLLSNDSVAVSLQRATTFAIPLVPNAYAELPEPITSAVVAVVSQPGAQIAAGSDARSLPVDLLELAPGELVMVSASGQGNGLDGAASGPFSALANASVFGVTVNFRSIPFAGRLTAAARLGSRPFYFSREPAGLVDRAGALHAIEGARSVADTGHDLFHGVFNDATRLACATCHAEGGDDGRTWDFSTGPRRTPSLRATIVGTAPYHWDAEFSSFAALSLGIFTGRMAGPSLSYAHESALARWVESLRALPAPAATDAERALAREGEAVFRSPEANCASCHSGDKFTNNTSVDVGTAGVFQVPSLIGLAYRAPYMHTGCAATLDARLSSMNCGGDGRHGGFSLDAQQRAALAMYLRSL
jgi:mono/diheme cytochrome c family protein